MLPFFKARPKDILDREGRLFEIDVHRRTIQCFLCGLISHNEGDVLHAFCGKCGVFLKDLEAQLRSA